MSDFEKQEVYIRKVSDTARSYAQDLLHANEKLSSTVAALQSENGRLKEQARSLKDEIELRQQEETRLQKELSETEIENQEFSERYLQVEHQSMNLANLYVASYRLHSTLDREEVLATIQEIIANLIGSEEITILELDEEGNALSLVACFGVERQRYERIPLGTGIIGKAASTGETFVAESRSGSGDPDEPTLTACIPLAVDGKVTGAIAIFRLLPQKNGFEDLDRELFDLLATQSATALYCTRLHAKLAKAGG